MNRLAVTTLAVLLATTAHAAEWPCFRGPNGDGHTDEKITVWPPVELWRAQIGQGFSEVVVSRGKVYTFGWANEEATVRCFSEDATGADAKPLWATSYACEQGRTDYPGTYPTPAVAGGKVYTSDNFGRVSCFDAATGALLWVNTAFYSEGDTDFGGSPFVEGDLLIVNSGAEGKAAGAISTKTHEVVWGASEDGSRYASPSAATIGGQRQVISYGQNVSGIDPSTGDVLWHFPWFHPVPAGGIASALIIDGETLFVSQGYNGGCAMAKLGGRGLLTKSWSNRELCTKVSSPVYFDGHVYGVAEEPASALRCVDLISGERRWSSEDEGRSFGTESAVLSAGDQIVVIAGDVKASGCGHLVVAKADPSAYTELHRAEGLLDGYTWSAPTLCNGKLYLRSQNGTLACYEVGAAPVDGYSVKISFDGYDKDETLTNFPALVRLSADIPGFEYDQFETAGGGDLRFAAADGTTELNYEVDTWDTDGASFVWVQVPKLSRGTHIWAFWGNPGLTAPPYTTNGATWDDTFAGVWHMNEAVANGGTQRDSTANHNDGVFTGRGRSVCGAPSVIGGGNHIDGSGGLRVDDSASLRVLDHVTMSIWAKSDDPAGWHGELISKRNDLALTPHPGNGASELMFAAYTGSGRKGCYYTAPDIADWHHWTGTYDAASGHAYVYCDGWNDPGTATPPGTGGPMHITSAIPIGDGGDLGFGFNTAAPGGSSRLWLDEARVENVPRSAAWVWACYMTMATNEKFQKYGAVQGSGFVPVPGAIQFSSATYDATEDGGLATITVTRADGSAGPVEATYAVAAGTATSGSDFAFTAGTVGFADGQTEATFAVRVLDDGDTEPDETVELTLSNPTGGASLGEPSRATLAVLDNDRPTLAFSARRCEVSSQHSRSVRIAVTRTKITEGAVSVTYSTSDGTATAGADYTAASGTVEFADGETSASFVVEIDRDAAYEPDETVKLTLSDPAGGAVLGDPAEAVLTIVGPPMPTIFDAWSERLRIEFNGYTRDRQLTNFPALVVFGADIPGFDYARFASPVGGDLRFTDASGTRELKYEIDRWDPGGSSHVWVQLPRLEKGCSIWAFWGNRDATVPPGYTTDGTAWDDSFVGVWHMGQPLPRDSTANRLHAASSSANETVDGLIGSAQSFSSASSSRAIVPHDDRLVFGAGDSYVLSAWAYAPAKPIGWHGVVTKSRDTGTNYGIWQNNSSWVYGCQFALWNGGRVKKGAWSYIAVTQNAEDHSRAIYFNGKRQSFAPGVNSSKVGAGDLWFGGAAGVSEYFDGLVDEVRIEKVPRSSDWIWACHMTMGSNALFTGYGTVRTTGGR